MEAFVTEYGPNAFYHSVNARKQCCYIRKVKPLARALGDADLWIAGLRRNQAQTRKNIQIFSYNEEHDIYKIAPLFNWEECDVWEFIRNNGVPYCKLYEKGYYTFGCRPCSRPIRPGDDIRAGRWWWESPQEKKECGIHIEKGKVVRASGSGEKNWSI